MRRVCLAAALSVSTPLAAAPAGQVRVRLVTTDGAIMVAIDSRHAPKTAANFLAYVDDGRLDGTSFYRAARSKGAPRTGLIEGGIGTDARRTLDPVALEPTSKTGLHHVDGTISMAHGANPDSATGNFSLIVGPAPGLDALGTGGGFAAFGHVVAGMDVVRRILAAPSGGGEGVMAGQMIVHPVKLIHAERIDGTPKPTGHAKPWLINYRH